MEIKTRKLFKELIKKLTLELLGEEDLEEVTSTGNSPGYSTPHAFVGKNKKKKNKKLKQSLKQVGYGIAEEIEYNLKLMIEDSKDKKEKQHKPGDVWERPSGDWAGKNSKGDIQYSLYLNMTCYTPVTCTFLHYFLYLAVSQCAWHVDCFITSGGVYYIQH